MSLLEYYYQDPAVRARLTEFLGGERLDRVTAYYATVNRAAGSFSNHPFPPHRLGEELHGGSEIARSLWDRESLGTHVVSIRRRRAGGLLLPPVHFGHRHGRGYARGLCGPAGWPAPVGECRTGRHPRTIQTILTAEAAR